MSDSEAAGVLFDFADPAQVDAWAPIDDRAMGGISRSRHHDSSGHAVFERNGGFASVRSAPVDRGRAGARSCVLDVRGDARRFKRDGGSR